MNQKLITFSHINIKFFAKEREKKIYKHKDPSKRNVVCLFVI